MYSNTNSSHDAFTEYFFEDFTVYTAKDYQKKISPTSKKKAYLFKYPWEMIRLSVGKLLLALIQKGSRSMLNNSSLPFARRLCLATYSSPHPTKLS
jgi:hypothetical protein